MALAQKADRQGGAGDGHHREKRAAWHRERLDHVILHTSELIMTQLGLFIEAGSVIDIEASENIHAAGVFRCRYVYNIGDRIVHVAKRNREAIAGTILAQFDRIAVSRISKSLVHSASLHAIFFDRGRAS